MGIYTGNVTHGDAYQEDGHKGMVVVVVVVVTILNLIMSRHAGPMKPDTKDGCQEAGTSENV